jgi:hypothetical protein
MTKIEQLKELLSDMEYPSMMEVVDAAWFRDNEEFHWNTDHNVEDLYNGDGNTYSGYQTESYTEWEGYLVVNLDTLVGYWMTYLFPLDKEVSPYDED